MRKMCLGLILLSLLTITLSGAPAMGQSSEVRFFRDRFVFLGIYQNQPLLATLTFDRGIDPQGRYNCQASFDGHLLFLNRWNHLRNRTYLQTAHQEDMEGIPPYHSCIVQWAEGSRIGAVNYEHQEISFLLQFRNLRVIDRDARRENFVIITGLADATMQFMGEIVPGRMVYQRMDLAGYNPFAHKLDAMRHRNFNRFFLFDNEKFYIIWGEMNPRGLRGLRFTPRRMIEYTPSEMPLDPGIDPPAGEVVSTDIEIVWTSTDMESNPDNIFREYPTGWRMTAQLFRDQEGNEREPLVMNLESASSFYWFNRGLFFVTGYVEGRSAWGMAEVIRGR